MFLVIYCPKTFHPDNYPVTHILKFLPEKKLIINFSMELTTNYYSCVKTTTKKKQAEGEKHSVNTQKCTSKCYLGDTFTPRSLQLPACDAVT